MSQKEQIRRIREALTARRNLRDAVFSSEAEEQPEPAPEPAPEPVPDPLPKRKKTKTSEAAMAEGNHEHFMIFLKVL